MFAIIAAVLFLISLIFQLAAITLGPVGSEFLNTLGFLFVALHLAGVGGRGFRR